MQNQEVVVDTGPAPVSELDTAADAAIADIVAEFDATPAEPAAPATPAEPVVKPAAVTPESPKTPEQDIAATIIRALEESRAKARAEKEARKAARRAEKEAARLSHTPADEVEALQRLGYDPDLVVRKVLAQKMGDQAPAELRQAIKEAERDRHMATLENKIIAQSRELAAKEYFNRVSQGAQEFLSSDAYHKDAPITAELSKRDPARVHAEIMQEIIADARTRAQKEPNGDIMSYATAISRVEKRWTDLKKLLTPENRDSQGNASTTQSAPTQESGQKPPPKAVRPPERPLAPWLTREDAAERSIREAVDEFRRVETTRK